MRLKHKHLALTSIASRPPLAANTRNRLGKHDMFRKRIVFNIRLIFYSIQMTFERTVYMSVRDKNGKIESVNVSISEETSYAPCHKKRVKISASTKN